jgi:hypothetical protein
MSNKELVIAQTKKWITDVVIACNFCPFAAREVKRSSINYIVESAADIEICLQTFLDECVRMDNDETTETSFIIYTTAVSDFGSYLDLVSLAEALIEKENYEGIYQVASFHPQYCFRNSEENDAANYTNRSIYPMLHILRESSIEKALEHYNDPENIPGRNIKFAHSKGLTYMKMLRDACLNV